MATLSELQARLTKYEASRDKILDNAQEIGSTSGRSQTFASLATIERTIAELERRIALARNGGRITSSKVIFRG